MDAESVAVQLRYDGGARILFRNVAGCAWAHAGERYGDLCGVGSAAGYGCDVEGGVAF